MRTVQAAILAAGLAISACRQEPTEQNSARNDQQPVYPAGETAPATESVANHVPLPKGSLPEPKRPIDAKSVEAAGQVVQHYGDLIEQSRFLQAERLWGDINEARSFATALDAKFGELHLQIGDLGDTEGAAGSIYTTVPVVFYGTSEQGRALRMSASVVLRRVNDVPGSTERQRRWHIERIEWKPA